MGKQDMVNAETKKKYILHENIPRVYIYQTKVQYDVQRCETEFEQELICTHKQYQGDMYHFSLKLSLHVCINIK